MSSRSPTTWTGRLRRSARPGSSCAANATRPPARRFFNLRTLVLEVVEAEGADPRLWGLTVVVEDLEALGPPVGEPRDAVQPGRRIATVPEEAGLPAALAFMTPRPQRSAPS